MKLSGLELTERYVNDLKRVGVAAGIVVTESILFKEIPGADGLATATYAGGLALAAAVGWSPLMRMTIESSGEYFFEDSFELRFQNWVLLNILAGVHVEIYFFRERSVVVEQFFI